jgi:ABC-2 type transport system permease protein
VLAAAALAGILFAAICGVLCFGASLAILAARNLHVELTAAHTLGLMVGPVTASALGAMLGVSIGTLIRNQIGAVVAVAAYAFTVDAILFAAVPSAGR